MKRFRVCISETRDFIHEIDAEDDEDAREIAKGMDAADGSLSDQFREQIVDWVEEI